MRRIKVTLKPLSAFGEEILGETLFGQLCWQLCSNFGTDELERLLKGYCEGNPFLVVSDACPEGHLPVPELPSNFWRQAASRKELKKREWIPIERTKEPLETWKGFSVLGSQYRTASVQTHNSINRETGTTGFGQFAPYDTAIDFYQQKLKLDCYFLLRDDFAKEHLLEALQNIGLSGYGRDASIGLGKFEVSDTEEVQWEEKPGSYLALASVDLSEISCTYPTFYKTKTHFGRHGSTAALYGNPFKKPVLLARRGAVITVPSEKGAMWHGRGISGISNNGINCVHQGYAPVFPLGYVKKQNNKEELT